MKCSLGISNFLEEISSLSHSIVFLYFFALIAEEDFLIAPCCSLELSFKWVYLSFSPLPFASLLFTAICKGLKLKFNRLKLKKVGKVTKPFRYDLNQIPYNYTVEVTNRFNGLDLLRVPEELWTEVRDIVQEAVIKTIPKKKKCKEAKWLSEEALQIAVKRREVKESPRRGLLSYIFQDTSDLHILYLLLHFLSYSPFLLPTYVLF